MNKFTNVLALAAAMALASPQVMAASIVTAGQKPAVSKSVAPKQMKRAKKASRQAQNVQKSTKMVVKHNSKKRISSHPKATKQNSRVAKAA